MEISIHNIVVIPLLLEPGPSGQSKNCNFFISGLVQTGFKDCCMTGLRDSTGIIYPVSIHKKVPSCSIYDPLNEVLPSYHSHELIQLNEVTGSICTIMN